ncbi:MAG TPA: hypothetical protein VGY77_04420 [Gemmataceae bacterium]|nr:hypothetical protein [Gemmataceae bacterium]
MDNNLVGYLLDALQPEERRDVENYLRSHAEARERLKRLKEMMKPLEADLDTIQAPQGLWMRALARVAEFQCRPLPAPPARPRSVPAVSSRRPWRRADALVAAGILLCLTLLIPPGINKLRYYHNRSGCQDNLRNFHFALHEYSERHNGRFPNVAETAPAPRNVAGTFVIVLKEGGFLEEGRVSVNCPSNGRQAPCSVPLQSLTTMGDEEFKRCASNLAGCYAYSLGYRDGNEIQGLRNDPKYGFLPIMADRPPTGVPLGDPGNSPNHAGQGQNVLFINGSCKFCPTRTVGYQQDDIYLNFDKKVAAGKNQMDTVLAPSDSPP